MKTQRNDSIDSYIYSDYSPWSGNIEDGAYEAWAVKVVNAYTDEFYDVNEDWCVDGSWEAQSNKWMWKLFNSDYKNINNEGNAIEDDGTNSAQHAAKVIERAHRMWIK